MGGMPISPAPSPIPSMRLLRLSDNLGSPLSSFQPNTPQINISNIAHLFRDLSDKDKITCMQELFTLCNREVLVASSQAIDPMLRHDPFKVLPWEISLRILSYIKDPKSLAAASQVSRLWYLVLSDDSTWKHLCEVHHFRRLSAAGNEMAQSFLNIARRASISSLVSHDEACEMQDDEEETGNTAISTTPPTLHNSQSSSSTQLNGFTFSQRQGSVASSLGNLIEMVYNPEASRYVKPTSYRSHFKQQYLLNNAWDTGGKLAARYVLQNADDVIVTELLMQDEFIILALDNSKILVFANDGRLLSSLCGHVMGVWALALHGKTLVSGGCDRDVRAWDLNTMQCTRILQGHTSTVRCLAMASAKIALSGSRDHTVRVWDVQQGTCLHTLEAHTGAVRCLKTVDDLAVSASYDCTVRIWRISTGELLHTLQGHQAQIYSLDVSGGIIASGALDFMIFLWDLYTGRCLGVLTGHVALVGQLQLRGRTLVSGSSDGAIRVWDVDKMVCRHRIIAHDNAITCLRFNDERIISGGPDGRVHMWDLATGQQIRSLGPKFTTVWVLAFTSDRLVVVGSDHSNTVFELISFVP